MKRPILTLRPTSTAKPEFIAYLDRAVKLAEAGKTIRFDNEANALAFLRNTRPYDLERAERTTTNDDLTSPFALSVLEADSIFQDVDE